MTLAVRPARIGDAAALADLGRQLNVQQRNPTEHYTEAVVRRDLFGANAAITPLLAEIDGVAVGYATYHIGYEPAYAARGLYMVDLFVAPHARRRGVARAILASVAAAAKACGAIYVWWVVKPWNEEALAFYRSLGVFEEPMVAQALVFDAFERLASQAKR